MITHRPSSSSSSVRPFTIFKQHLLLNHWLDFDQTSQECSLFGPLSKLFKWFRSIAYLVTGAKNRFFNLILKKSSCQKPLDRFQYNFAEMILWWSSTKIVQAIWIREKNLAARGRGFFSLYIYIENFKNLLVRNHWTNFNIILQNCFFGDPLPRLFKPFGFVKKHGRQGTGLIFPI